jgi:hypothetical protein
MRILRISGFKRCVDGTILREYTLDRPVTREMVSYFTGFGTVTVMESTKQPFYCYTREGFFTIKGLVGDTGFFARFIKEQMDVSAVFLQEMIARYVPGQPGAGAIDDQDKLLPVQDTWNAETGPKEIQR